jgi:pyruvate,water dikinase
MKEVFASLYNDRAIATACTRASTTRGGPVGRRAAHGALRQGAAGVMFTIDTESGFEDVVFITASYGLGETVVQGAVNPDEFYVHKPMLKAGKPAVIRRNLGSKLIKMVFATPRKRPPTASWSRPSTCPELRNRYSLTDADVQQLAKYALVIEQHYGRPMDIEWGKDGTDGQLYILQARPETVKSQAKGQAELRYKLKGTGTVLAEAAPSARRSAPAPCAWCPTSRRWTGAARRRAGHRHDRPELGAGDEARRPSSPTAAAVPATRPSSPVSWASRPSSAAATPPIC